MEDKIVCQFKGRIRFSIKGYCRGLGAKPIDKRFNQLSALATRIIHSWICRLPKWHAFLSHHREVMARRLNDRVVIPNHSSLFPSHNFIFHRICTNSFCTFFGSSLSLHQAEQLHKDHVFRRRIPYSRARYSLHRCTRNYK